METNTTTLKTENQANLYDDAANETDDQWGSDLVALVTSNENVDVICPWMGGAKVTLGEAMTTYNYPANMTAADIPFVMSVVQELLANRVTDEEKTEEEGEIEKKEDETAKTESGKKEETSKPQEATIIQPEKAAQKESSKTDFKKSLTQPEQIKVSIQSKAETKIAKPVTIPAEAVLAEKAAMNQSNSLITMEAKAIEAAQPALETAAAEPVGSKNTSAPAAAVSSSNEVQIANDDSGNSKQTTANSDIGHQAVPAPTPIRNNIIEQKPATRSKIEAQQLPAFKKAEAVIEEPAKEPKIDPVIYEPVQELEIENVIMSEESDENTVLEIIEPAALVIDGEAFIEDTAEIAFEELEFTEEEPAHQELDYKIDGGPIDFDGEEVQIDNLEFIEMAPSEQDQNIADSFSNPEDLETDTDVAEEIPMLQADLEPALIVQEKIVSPENPIQADLNIEVIEDTLVELAEAIEISEPELVEMVNENLDRIIELPKKLNADETETALSKEEAHEELEERFIKIFEALNLDYTPEMIESLVQLTLNLNFGDEIEKLKKETIADQSPQDRGTHEIITKLLAGLGSIKKAMAHAWAIGQSALRLSNFNLTLNA